MSIGKIHSPLLQQWHALNTLKANFWRIVNTKRGLDWLKHWNQYQQFTQQQPKHFPNLKFLFWEHLQRKQFFKKISMMNSKGLERKVSLNQTAHVVFFRQIWRPCWFFKIVLNELHVPAVTLCIRVDDKVHVKLFLMGKIQLKKKQVYSSEVMQYTLLLLYSSLKSYKLLLGDFPLPSISLLNKITEGNIDALREAKLLLENSSIYKDIVVLFDGIYLQKCVECCRGEIFGSNISNVIYKSTVCFMIIGLKENVSSVVKAAPVIFINSKLLKDGLLNCLEL